MDAKDKARILIVDMMTPGFSLWKNALNVMDEIIDNAKKEVFDDIEKIESGFVGSDTIEINQESYDELKKRHLSTFAEQKRRNNELIQSPKYPFRCVCSKVINSPKELETHFHEHKKKS